jgi:hypothetical protein
MAENDASIEKTLEKLEIYVRMEYFTLYFVVLGVVCLFACNCSQDPNSPAFKILEYTVLTCCVMDTYFSVFVTALFLRPISKVLTDGRLVAQHSKGFKQLQKTKYNTLFGSSLAVVSSTILYVFLLLFFDGRNDIVFNNGWLNPLVIGKHKLARIEFPLEGVSWVRGVLLFLLFWNFLHHTAFPSTAGNLDSMMNDLGMLFVCGFFKHMNRNVLTTFLGRGSAAATSAAVAPNIPDCAIDSHAYD